MKLYIHQSQEGLPVSSVPRFTVRYTIEVSSDEVDVLAAYLPGWASGYDGLTDLTAALNPNGVEKTFLNVRDANNFAGSVHQAYQNFATYMSVVHEFTADDTLEFFLT